MGVRQGDPISPNLFKIFINDIMNYIEVNDKTPVLNNMKISHLLYADDMVLLARSEEDIQKSVNSVDKFCKDWGLQVNTDKSKVMVFNTKGSLIKTNVKCGDTKLDDVMSYKYLGICFHINCKFQNARQDLLDRSFKAMYKLTSCFRDVRPSFNTCVHLFDHAVKPILMYGADVCGYRISKSKSLYNEMMNDIFEKCHLKYCRYILGVNRFATKIGLYGETGRFPIGITNITLFIKYWYRVSNCKESPDNLLYNAFAENTKLNSSWYKSVCNLLKKVNMNLSESKMRNKSKHFIVAELYDIYKAAFIDGWKKQLFNDVRRNDVEGNKLRNYRRFKSNFGTADYLKICDSYIFRSNICKLRISCHNLLIERGRYFPKKDRLEVSKRICIYCNSNNIEDEQHFLLECNYYDEERQAFYKTLISNYQDFSALNSTEKFNFIMCNADKKILWALGHFVTICFKKRNK
jgi:hypothetical protein